MKGLISAALLITLVFGLATGLAWAQEPDPYLDFAHSLYEEGDYYRAVTEAKRFIFLHPEHERRVEARLLIARAYLAGGREEEARKSFEQVIAQNERPDLAAEALKDLGRLLEQTDPQGRAVEYYQAMSKEPNLPAQSSDDLQNHARFRLGWVHLEAGEWAEAEESFRSVDQGHALKGSADQLARQARAGENLPYRSPAAAGFMSGLLPGAGQLYVGRPLDAALAFGLNAVFIWGAYESARSENWAAFGILGAMEIGWYGGNIYNAVNGAHIYNREARDHFIQKLKREHGWRMGMTPDGQGVRLSWTVRY